MAILLCGCGAPEAKKERQAPLVTVSAPVRQTFIERIEAVGTARANEQVTLASPVTERIERLSFDDGQYVRQGQVIAVLAQRQQTAALASASAQARSAQQQLDRLEALKARGFVTNASVDAQIAVASSARADAEAARSQIGDRIVRAPFSGYASLRTISAGAVVSQGTPIATISDISRIKLDFTVPETMLTALSPGQPIMVRAAAYPGRAFAGTIATIDPVIDPNTRAVLIRAILSNADGALKPGMLLNVAIQARQRTSFAVPELAVVGEGDARFVYVVDGENRTRRRTVETGTRSDGMIEVVKGLKSGDKIVTEGIVKAAEGLKVRTAPARAGAGR